MNSLNKNIRILPIIGISLTLIGYIYLTFQTYKLNEKKHVLKKEIEELEIIKTELINGLKGRDTIILMQRDIISQSSDQKTVDQGIKLEQEIKKPNSKFFTITKDEDADIELARKFENDGFKYLIEKDANQAISSFIKSENSYNGYNRVYEIAVFLNKNKDRLSDKNSEFWKDAYIKILKDYSWKMPEEYKVKIIEQSH